MAYETNCAKFLVISVVKTPRNNSATPTALVCRRKPENRTRTERTLRFCTGADDDDLFTWNKAREGRRRDTRQLAARQS